MITIANASQPAHRPSADPRITRLHLGLSDVSCIVPPLIRRPDSTWSDAGLYVTAVTLARGGEDGLSSIARSALECGENRRFGSSETGGARPFATQSKAALRAALQSASRNGRNQAGSPRTTRTRRSRPSLAMSIQSPSITTPSTSTSATPRQTPSGFSTCTW